MKLSRPCRDWPGLLRLRQLLADAVERGKPLWPVTTYVEYRIALEAPGPEVARVLRSGVGRFALGPLTEVAAATHAWDELGPHLAEPGIAGTVAQERVLRGEDLRNREGTHPEVLELPDPGVEPVERVASTAEPGPELAQPDTVRALTDLVEVWTSESNGAARAVVVRGGPAEAVAT